MSSLPTSFHPPINPHYPFLIPTLPRYMSTQPSQIVREQPIVSSPQLNLGMLTNSSPMGIHNPFLAGCHRMSFPHSVAFSPFYRGLMPSQVPTVPYPVFSAHVPSMQTVSPPVSSPGLVRISGVEPLSAFGTCPTGSSESLRVNEPLYVATMRGMPLLSSPVRTTQSVTDAADSPFYKTNSNSIYPEDESAVDSDSPTPSAGPGSFRGAGKSEHTHKYSDLESTEHSSTSPQGEDERTCSKNGKVSAEVVVTLAHLSDSSSTTNSADLTFTHATNTSKHLTTGLGSKQREDVWTQSPENELSECDSPYMRYFDMYSKRSRHPQKSSFVRACSKTKYEKSNVVSDEVGLGFQLAPPLLSSDVSVQDEQTEEQRIKKVPPLLKMAEHPSTLRDSRNNSFDIVYSHERDVNNIAALPVISSRISTNIGVPYVANKMKMSPRETESVRIHPEETNILPGCNPRAVKKRKWGTISGFLPDSSEKETTVQKFNPCKRVKKDIETCSANYKPHGTNKCNTSEKCKASKLKQVLRMQSVRSNNTFPSLLDTVAVATN